MLRPNRQRLLGVTKGYINWLEWHTFKLRVAFGCLGTSGDRIWKVRGSNPIQRKDFFKHEWQSGRHVRIILLLANITSTGVEI